MTALSLSGRVAVVTGASRGVGRGIAKVLAESGAVVYGTGRTIQQADLPSSVVRIACDHTDDDAVHQAFAQIARAHGSTCSSTSIARAAAPKRRHPRELPVLEHPLVATPDDLADPGVMRHSGRWLVAATLAQLYGFTDIDGARPRPLSLDDV